MQNNLVPYEMQGMVRGELEPGERIVWSGMPRRAFFTKASTGAFFFGIPWTAFAIFWTLTAGAGTWFMSGFSLFSLFPLFGVPFILIGLAMLSSPLVAYFKSGKTVYVITDRRAISFIGGRETEIRSYTPEMLGNVYRRERKNGRGDVIIEHRRWRDSDGDKQSEEIGFFRVSEPKEVERLLKELGRPHRRAEKDTGSIYSS